MIKKLNKNKKARTLVTFLCVLISALSQAYVIQVFIQPANLLSSGFTGVAILIEKITSTYFGFSFSTSLGMIVLNVPVAILCYKNVSPRFTLFSLLQVFLASLFLKVCQFQPLFNDILFTSLPILLNTHATINISIPIFFQYIAIISFLLKKTTY